MKNRLFKKLKRAFTLIELTVVITATSILMIGFTSFTIFFTNAYSRENETTTKTNSALYMKNAIWNHIENYNYTYEYDVDFKDENNDKILDNNKLFSVITPQGDHYTGAIIRDYHFKDSTEENFAYFGYTETIYTFTNSYDPSSVSVSELRELITTGDNGNITTVSTQDFYVYKALSHMKLKVHTVEETHLSSSVGQKLLFELEYDFESLDALSGKQKITFNKYIYYM